MTAREAEASISSWADNLLVCTRRKGYTPMPRSSRQSLLQSSSRVQFFAGTDTKDGAQLIAAECLFENYPCIRVFRLPLPCEPGKGAFVTHRESMGVCLHSSIKGK